MLTLIDNTTDKAADNIYTLKISLSGSNPLIWRRIEMDCKATLYDLHDSMQAIMPWDECHLHIFRVGDKRYGVPDPEVGENTLDEAELTLSAIFKQHPKGFTYIYDFGDDWLHTIEFEGCSAAEPDVTYPKCLDGDNACPPEDCGGLFGYYQKLNIIKDPQHPDHDDTVEWMPEDFDPNAFDLELANELLFVSGLTDDEFAELIKEDDFRDTLTSTCAWCHEPISDHDPGPPLMLQAPDGDDLSAEEGKFIMLPFGTDELPTPAFVLPSDSEAKRDGYDMAILLCSEACRTELSGYLEQDGATKLPEGRD